MRMMNPWHSVPIEDHPGQATLLESPLHHKRVGRRAQEDVPPHIRDGPIQASKSSLSSGPRDRIEFGVARRKYIRGVKEDMQTGWSDEKRYVPKPYARRLDVECSSPPHQTQPRHKRPPLADLPVNRFNVGATAIPNAPQPIPDLQTGSSTTVQTRSSPVRPRSSPRKLLWPNEHAKDRSKNVVDRPRARADVLKEHRYQTFKPQRVKSPMKPKIVTIDPYPKHRESPRPPRIPWPVRKKVSYAEQRYTPLHKTKSDLIRDVCRTAMTRQGTSDSKETQEEGKPGLVKLMLDRLPQSPPTLHAHESTMPPNPGSPSRRTSSKDSIRSAKDNTLASLPSVSGEPGVRDVSPKNTMRKLLRWEIWAYRILFGTLLMTLNISLLIVYLFAPRHHYLLAFLVFMKSKDLLSTIAGILGSLWFSVNDLIHTPKDVDSKWIMSLVCAYAESEIQIMKTVNSLVNQNLVQHKQVICIILDGKPRDVLSHFTRVTHMMKRSYVTWKFARGDLQVHAGFLRDTPVILIQKSKNAGKKDSLILGHSLFNYPRDDAPMDIRLLRRDIFTHVLPALTGIDSFKAFDSVYATDADSTLHSDCLKELANALGRNSKAIAVCGIIIADLEDSSEWSAWHLFQQFQYTFGQYVRRQAESVWGRVTCLPGPVTMTAVRPEMAKAISDYAAPITTPNLFLHQVQYQGTDRRLTWCMLSQSRNLETVLVTKAIGQTVVPTSLDHYLSQRRRWAANAYFNDYMYTFGKQQHPITRLLGLIDIIRMSFVYYRVINTALFIRSLIRHFYLVKIIPTLILTKSPTTWFLLLILIKEPVLRRRLHKLICGIALNQIMSPVLSVIVFSRVLLNMGNHAWGKTGISSKEAAKFSVAYIAPPSPKSPWSPRRLVSIIKNAVQPLALHQEPFSEKQSERSGSSSAPSTHTPTANSKASSISDSSEKAETIPLPLIPQTPLGAALSSAITPLQNSLGVAESPAPQSTVRRRARPA